jgi:transcriptional regulator with XRE-family HTH domain
MLDPALLATPAIRAALAAREIGQVYRLLNAAGIPQRTIATLVGQSQSEVSEIINGRRVQSYAVLARIYTGLGVSWEALELSSGAYPGQSPVPELSAEDEAEVLRRQFDHLLALAGVTWAGTAIPGLGKLLSPVALPSQPLTLPARIGQTDIKAIDELTRGVREVARTVGGQAGPACALAGWADQYLTADASDATRQGLLSALADLHVMAAWCCHDSGAPVVAYQHFAWAVERATEAGDSYLASRALLYAASMLIQWGQPDKSLKLVQLAADHLAGAPQEDPRVAPLRSQLTVQSARAQAQLAEPGSAVVARRVRSTLARSRDGYEPPSLHHRAEMDLSTSRVHLDLGELDTAESLAAASARTFAQDNHRRGGVQAGIIVARVHVLTGEPDAAQLTTQAIEAVLPLRSSIAQTQLAPLAHDLTTRPDLAPLAQKITHTRA